MLGGGIAKITYVTEWEVGWGTYEGKDATQSGVFYQGKNLPAKNPITWLGETTLYLTSYSLNSKGEWTFEDRSTGADVGGTDGKIKK